MVSGICFTNEREWDAKYLNTEFQRSPNFNKNLRVSIHYTISSYVNIV